MEAEDEDDDHFGSKDPYDGYLLHHPVLSTEAAGDYTSESRIAKRKVESAYGLFCVMRKRTCTHNISVLDDIVDNSGSDSGSEADLSECSEYDVLSQHVVQDEDFVCNFPCPSEDEGTLVGRLSSETGNCFLLLSPDEANEENGARSKEDEVLSFVSASPIEFQSTTDPQNFSGYSNDISLLHSEREKGKMSCISGICEDILRCSNKEGPEVHCNSDVFKNDGDTSSANEVRYGDVVSVQGSLEKMRRNDNITLVTEDDEPIPISSVPPDGGSSILLETFSLHPIVRCLNDYNVHDGKIGLEISPIPLTKTFEGPSRPWSVCGSTAAVRNIPLLEDGSGACSSSDEQLYVNVSSSECRDAEFSQTPSTLYQEEVDGEDEISFSDIDAMIRELNLVPDDSDSCLNREEWNMSKHPSQTLRGLEHCTRTSIRRAIMSQGAIAVLLSRGSKHFIRKHEVIIGRSSYGMNVDIDLGKDGYGSKISRHQALVKLENKGSFSLTNLGKRDILVNGENLNTGQIVSLTSCSSIDIRGIVFEFKVNKEAVRQFLKNNTRRNSEDDTKFKWCE